MSLLLVVLLHCCLQERSTKSISKLKQSSSSLNFYTTIVVVEVSLGGVVVVEVETTEAIDVGDSAIVAVVEERISCKEICLGLMILSYL